MAIIKNYGLRWVRAHVDWGTPGKGNNGTLKGRLASAKRSKPVDFRDQMGVYVLYENGFVPVYIGQAGAGNASLFLRLRQHKKDHLRDRWTHFSWFGLRAVSQSCNLYKSQTSTASQRISYSGALDEIEGILIEVLEPRLNKQGATWQKAAKEYVQYGPDDDDPVRLSHLMGEIRELKALLTA